MWVLIGAGQIPAGMGDREIEFLGVPFRRIVMRNPVSQSRTTLEQHRGS